MTTFTPAQATCSLQLPTRRAELISLGMNRATYLPVRVHVLDHVCSTTLSRVNAALWPELRVGCLMMNSAKSHVPPIKITVLLGSARKEWEYVKE